MSSSEFLLHVALDYDGKNRLYQTKLENMKIFESCCAKVVKLKVA